MNARLLGMDRVSIHDLGHCRYDRITWWHLHGREVGGWVLLAGLVVLGLWGTS